jgi:hypothetical protein
MWRVEKFLTEKFEHISILKPRPSGLYLITSYEI